MLLSPATVNRKAAHGQVLLALEPSRRGMKRGQGLIKR